MTQHQLPVPPEVAARRSAAANKAWATRRALGWSHPRSGGQGASSRSNAQKAAEAEALAAFEIEDAKSLPDWHAVALKLKRALIERAKPRTIGLMPESAQVAAVPWHDYPVNKISAWKLQSPSPVLIVAFADGEVVRAPAVSVGNKPVNIGRGLRVAIAFYHARACRRLGLKNRPGTRPAVPVISSCICETTGETYDVEQCNLRTAEDRKAQDWKMKRKR